MTEKIDGKISFGSTSIDYPPIGNLGTVNNLLIENNYSSLIPTGKRTYKAVPNDGKHNIVIVDAVKGKINFHYTDLNGEEQARDMISEFKKSLEEKLEGG